MLFRSSAGGIAGSMGGGNGFLFGGPGAITRYGKKRKKTKESMKSAESNPSGPNFTGYWKGSDKGKPGKKMVGSD